MNKLATHLDTLSEQTKDLYGEDIDEFMNGFPCGDDEVLNFIQHYLGQNKPVVFRNAITDWPAFGKWNSRHLVDLLKDKEMSVACTPSGRADAVDEKEGLFIKPMEVKMKFNQFMKLLQNKKRTRTEEEAKSLQEEAFNGMDSMNSVFYAQHQNSSLTKEFPELLNDVPENLPFAVKAFENMPDAVNLWIGDGQSTSSLHKDPYENIYCVLAGEKIFTLYPPSDIINVPYKHYKEAHYKFEDGKWSIEEEESEVPWISIDPDEQTPEEIIEQYPRYKNATPFKVVIGPGDALYLPSLWLHQVAQQHNEEGIVLAVNYWHDMQYGALYNYNHFLCNLQLDNLVQE